MKTISLFIIACLATSVLGTSLFEDTFSEFRDSDFGKNLVESIELQLKTGGKVGDIIKLCHKVRDDLKEQYDNAYTAHEKYEDECQADRTKLLGKISKAKADSLREEGLGSVVNDRLTSRT